MKWGRLKNLKRRLGFFASLRMTEGLEITASGCSAEIVTESPALDRRVRVARPPATSKSSTLASDLICTTSNTTSYPQGVAGTGTYLSQVVTNTAGALCQRHSSTPCEQPDQRDYQRVAIWSAVLWGLRPGLSQGSMRDRRSSPPNTMSLKCMGHQDGGGRP